MERGIPSGDVRWLSSFCTETADRGVGGPAVVGGPRRAADDRAAYPFGSPLTAVPTTGPQEESCRAQKPCLAQPRVAWSASYCPHPPDSPAGCRLTGRCGSRGTARVAGCCEERTDVPGSAEAARTSRAYVLAAWMAPWRDPWSSSTRKRTTGLLPSPARSSREGIPKAEVACGRAVPQSRRQQTWRAA